MPAESPRSSDARFMRRALALAARGLGRTYPNPPVGAVLVRGGRVVGEGFHAKAGAPHAEIEAIRAAGARARGAELFVTLEPCTHQGRTPPCLDAVLALDPARVVVAAVDPDPRVRGRGIRGL
ncbi:MAG TPA: bifunctional diaminohydroxyphosphoribosylaminopyrimidine deaminase/5-amino-6-(5-phosphoribosylamino)uracil reductase RibD, partial [Candidatus Binatia bacterium]|nr:bifunctional diaminohydroxyphosphoribosylaminopyrimidine deaminase/5-amino-6-(5-phosphoribosylamino)uracil reductase RibD [Candidatus Binatia bacterium]